MAKRRFGLGNIGQILQPTALVNELYLKLMGGYAVDWKDRAHFFAVASLGMRQILIDHIKRDSAEKRGGGAPHISLDESVAIIEDRRINLLILDEALAALEKIQPRWAQVVVCRYFGGMTEEEIAEALGVCSRTVKRDWKFARAWLRGQFSK
jgi:RNA polymerase sigma factor (TIGR02999 family)